MTWVRRRKGTRLDRYRNGGLLHSLLIKHGYHAMGSRGTRRQRCSGCRHSLVRSLRRRYAISSQLGDGQRCWAGCWSRARCCNCRLGVEVSRANAWTLNGYVEAPRGLSRFETLPRPGAGGARKAAPISYPPPGPSCIDNQRGQPSRPAVVTPRPHPLRASARCVCRRARSAASAQAGSRRDRKGWWSARSR